MPREVELDLQTLMALRRLKKAELAELLDVSVATASSYVHNRWTVLDRTVLERLADIFQCDAAALLKTRDSHFLDTFRTQSDGQPICYFLCRPDLNLGQDEKKISRRDSDATALVSTFLKNAVDRLVAFEDKAITSEEFDEHLKHNCVVLGSPWVNAATEWAIYHAFNVTPLSAASLLPFVFKLTAAPLHHGQSSVYEPSNDGRRGIWLRDEKEFLEADQWPRDEFRSKRLTKARDCGVVIVKNHLVDGSRRKLIVLSGFSGVGTEAAAQALVKHYKDLEPIGAEETVWGVIEVFYRKQADEMSRKIIKYNWRYRSGGRCPVLFTMKKSSA